MAALRTFIALSSSADVRNSLRDIQKLLIEEDADVKWDTPDKFHITLKFLGNIDEESLPHLSEALASVTAGSMSLQLVYDTLGGFPDLVHPKVLWVGARATDALTTLQREVELACEKLRIPREARTFHPHITLGRVKGPANLARLTARLKSITFDPIETTCSEVLLIKSDLRPTGSVYTTLKLFPLKA